MLGPGSDPLKLIEDLAKRKKIKTLVVSMGQGQEIIARRYMATAAADGQWVLLQNTHLSLAYLSEARAPLARGLAVGACSRGLWSPKKCCSGIFAHRVPQLWYLCTQGTHNILYS